MMVDKKHDASINMIMIQLRNYILEPCEPSHFCNISLIIFVTTYPSSWHADPIITATFVI